MTSSNGNIFRVTGPLWGEPPVIGGFPSKRPVTLSFDVFFDLRLNKRLSKQSRRIWFETPLRSVWRHCNEVTARCWVSTTPSALIHYNPSTRMKLLRVNIIEGNMNMYLHFIVPYIINTEQIQAVEIRPLDNRGLPTQYPPWSETFSFLISSTLSQEHPRISWKWMPLPIRN